jgi:hypothetical protein
MAMVFHHQFSPGEVVLVVVEPVAEGAKLLAGDGWRLSRSDQD